MRIFNETSKGKIDSWAYRWLYSIWNNHGKCVQSNVNMIKNIGFSQEATHTKGFSLRGLMEPQPLGDIVHPSSLDVNTEADERLFRLFYSGRGEDFAGFIIEISRRIEAGCVGPAQELLGIIRRFDAYVHDGDQ